MVRTLSGHACSLALGITLTALASSGCRTVEPRASGSWAQAVSFDRGGRLLSQDECRGFWPLAFELWEVSLEREGVRRPVSGENYPNSPGRTIARTVQIEGQKLFIVAAELVNSTFTGMGSYLVVLIADESGRCLSVSSLYTGHRLGVATFSIEVMGDRFPSLVIRCDVGHLFVVPAARQIYAMTGGGLTLVRIEGTSGKAIRNLYRCPVAEVGRALRCDADDWEDLLRSDAPAEVLAALGWLGAQHESSCTKHAEARREASVRERVSYLQSVGDPWISEAAQVAGQVVGTAVERSFRD